ncbi:hypothetical protein B0T22DRAFT_494444 [Podospora appendiculata]|uniref:Uncharacterized protein n=1 Tax=Podospora appendiculata TaxID=314037 RepID=A0AAE0X1Q2_9PEZI|nr:hypothetical protein B0T22DRAFT_494444 [Podospora appendiculata]
MPPKRAASAASGTAKRFPNTDAEYKITILNPLTAYEYVCMCQAPFQDGDDENEDEEGDEDNEDDGGKKCDGGKTCLCDNPAADHLDRPWKLTVAGKAKTFNTRTHCDLRDPDNFGMYTFNDHLGYGVVEVLQNIFLDFEEAADNWKERWAICEGLAFFMSTGYAHPILGIDDGDLASATFELIGRLFVATLAHLERENLLSKDSEVKNLGLIMALFLKLPHDYKDYGFFESSRAESIGPAKDKNKWSPHKFVDQVVSYAHKYDIAIAGPKNAAALAAGAKTDAALPLPGSNTAKADVFGFAKALKSYSTKKEGGTTKIGGDYLDITTWTSAERKKHSFSKKDPLGKKELDVIKEGLLIGLA